MSGLAHLAFGQLMSRGRLRHCSRVRGVTSVVLAVLAGWLAAAPAQAIVGSAPAAAGQWPWMAAILDTTESGGAAWQQYCGGVVIAPRRVLTAAHCAAGQSASDTAVLLPTSRAACCAPVRRTARAAPASATAVDRWSSPPPRGPST